MSILFLGLSWFVVVFLIHLGIWKIRVPEQPFKMLLFIFLFFAMVGFVFWWLIPTDFFPDYFMQTTGIEFVHAELLFLCLAISYMFFYQGLKTQSASISMVMMVAEAGEKGIDRSAFNSIISDEKLIKPRIRFLTSTGMAFISGEKYILTTKGKLYARSFAWYRKCLKLPEYGG